MVGNLAGLTSSAGDERAGETPSMILASPRLLDVNGGYVDTASLLALHGLVTAHITGTVVTLGTTLVHGSTGAISKLAALVFCAVIMATRLLTYTLVRYELPVRQTMASRKIWE
jgi:uncharacterized membrane protein YoaK (UPF0700 family)